MEWKGIWLFWKNKVYKLNKGNGFIKEYDNYGRLIFEGNYLKGERNGKGKKYFDYNIIFEDDYLNGKKKWKRKVILSLW